MKTLLLCIVFSILLSISFTVAKAAHQNDAVARDLEANSEKLDMREENDEAVLMDDSALGDNLEQQFKENKHEGTMDDLGDSDMVQQMDDNDDDNDDDNNDDDDDDDDGDDDSANAQSSCGRIHHLPHTAYRRAFSSVCPGNRHAFYYAYSRHWNRQEDRIWGFRCKRVPGNVFLNYCTWTPYLNIYDGPLLGHCPANHIMTGISSIYSIRHRDRRFKIRCCRALGYTTKSCQFSGYVNTWDGLMNYGVGSFGSRFFTGLFSLHSNVNQDRRWKFHSCTFSR